MFSFNRKMLAMIGAAVATTSVFVASPAQAAAAGKAEVLGLHNSIVKFIAAKGHANSMVITISGRTVTLNDPHPIKAGKGCKAVKGDRTKVKCTTARKPTDITVILGDKNDTVRNTTGIWMVANGGSGNDTLIGGSYIDRLFGESGNDTIYGRGANDAIDGGPGNDRIYGGNGNDWADGDTGNDTLYGERGNDTLHGGAGNDRIIGGPGKDVIRPNH
ncbi:calcium-binding protein [Actinoplanes solisilvae]|uniref:calcium-binding protein n=1 Tax=Actinoplanes solisilvae TaxID=2486853 RepID=UPI000FDCACE2|nr:calcium-binding protein [Actinoplanes solisilvae]